MTWGVATALLEQRGDEGLFEVDEAWLPRVAAQLRPAPDRARQPLPRPARPLRRAGARSPTSGRSWSRRAPGAPRFVLNADDPLIADLGRDARAAPPRRASPTSGSRTPRQALPELQHAFDAKHCRRCGAPLRLRARLRRPPRPLLVPQLRRRPAARPTSPRPRSSCTACAARASPCARPQGELELELPLPGLYNVYNALAAIAAGAAARRRARADRRRRSSRCEAVVRPGRDDRGRRQAGLDPADQEPGRRQRGPAHAAPRGRRAAAARPLDRAQRPDRRRPRRLLDLGRRLRAARRRGAPRRLRRHPGAGDGAAAQVRRLAGGARSRSSEAIERSLDRGRRGGAAAGSSPCPPTPPCSSCARCSPTAAWRKEFWRVSASTATREVIWHDVECGGYAADLPLWDELAGAGATARCSSSAAGTGRVALHLAARGHEVVGARRATRRCSTRSTRARPPSRLAVRRRCARRPRRSSSAATFALVVAPDAAHPAARRTGRARRGLLRAAAAHLAPGGPCSRRDRRRVRARRRGDGRAAASRRARGRRLGLLEPAARASASSAGGS